MRAYERLLKYVTFDTASGENPGVVPSTEHQWELARFLEKEMKALGLTDVTVSDHCYVYGVLPANDEIRRPNIGFIAHMDTSPDASGANVRPRIVKYEGGDIQLNENVSITEKAFPFLKNYLGDDLIVTDGTTLLGADDKAGIAEIMSAMEYLVRHPEVKHGRVSVAFTPDEEVGAGPNFFDVPLFGADYAYTVDGSTLGEIEYENFNAASCKVTVHGVGVHPGSAKNVMKNAALIAAEMIGMLPEAEKPEHTEGREGFYHVCGIEGSVTEAALYLIIRDHSAESFEKRKAFLKSAGDFLNAKYGEGTVEVEVKDSYRNMLEMITPHMEIIDKAKDAMEEAGITPVEVPIRGGTDGATLSFMGLPCPNLCTGGENFHGVMEFASIQSMDKCTEIILNIVRNA